MALKRLTIGFLIIFAILFTIGLWQYKSQVIQMRNIGLPPNVVVELKSLP